MTLERPTVFPEINEIYSAVIGDFYCSDKVILDLVFDEFSPTGKRPFEIPPSVDAVRNQKEGVPYDSDNPLYPFGHGLGYSRWIKGLTISLSQGLGNRNFAPLINPNGSDRTPRQFARNA